MENKINKFSIITGAMGLIFLGVVFITNSSYPSMIFKIFAPLGLFFIFVSLLLFVIKLIMDIKKDIGSKKYLSAFVMIVLAIVLFLRLFK